MNCINLYYYYFMNGSRRLWISYKKFSITTKTTELMKMEIFIFVYSKKVIKFCDLHENCLLLFCSFHLLFDDFRKFLVPKCLIQFQSHYNISHFHDFLSDWMWHHFINPLILKSIITNTSVLFWYRNYISITYRKMIFLRSSNKK